MGMEDRSGDLEQWGWKIGWGSRAMGMEDRLGDLEQWGWKIGWGI